MILTLCLPYVQGVTVRGPAAAAAAARDSGDRRSADTSVIVLYSGTAPAM